MIVCVLTMRGGRFSFWKEKIEKVFRTTKNSTTCFRISENKYCISFVHCLNKSTDADSKYSTDADSKEI